MTGAVGEGAGAPRRAGACCSPSESTRPCVRIDSNTGDTVVAGEHVLGGVAGAAVADLGEQLRGRDHGAFEQRQEDGAVGMLVDRGGDLALELLDLRVQGLDHRDQRQHEVPPRGKLELADATVSCPPELGQQLRRVLPPAVALSLKKRPQARFAKPRRVRRLG